MKKLSALILILALCMSPAALAEYYAPLRLDAEQSYALNLFLSNFTEVGMEHIDAYSDEKALVDFAHDHMWFNSYEAYEYGAYAGGNNCRVSDDRIQEIIDAFFYYPPQVDLSRTRFDYDGEYYYHCETGGWSNSGFAHAMSVCPVGNDQYFISFAVFGSGGKWDNSAMDDDISRLIAEFTAPDAYGSALIHAEDLADRSSYRMISMTLH